MSVKLVLRVEWTETVRTCRDPFDTRKFSNLSPEILFEWIAPHGSVDQWISERCMYVTPIRLDLLLNTNQISCYKVKWYVRRVDPDTVENGHIYSSVKEEEVFIYGVYLNSFCGLG